MGGAAAGHGGARVRRAAGSPGPAAATPACCGPAAPDLRAAGNLAVQRLRRSPVAIGAATDAAEREADLVAERVVPGAPVRRPCAGCAAAEEEEPVPPSVVTALAGPGAPLPPSLRMGMESVFGRDLGAVRVHTGPDATASAAEINARAYTLGHDVVVGGAAPPLESAGGRRLIAHELAHVVQQGSRVRRQDDETATAVPAAPPALPADVARRISYAATVLRRVAPLPEEDRARLDQVIPGAPVLGLIRERDSKRTELDQHLQWVLYYEATNAAVERGEQLAAGVPAGPELMQELQDRTTALTTAIEQLTTRIAEILTPLGTDEQGLAELVWSTFPAIWERRAKAIAHAMLDQNEDVARHERERYSELVCSPDTEGLLEADARLGRETADLESMQLRAEALTRQIPELEQRIASGQSQIEHVERWGPLPGGIPPSAEEMQALRDELERLTAEAAALPDRIEAQERTLTELRMEYIADFPILGSREYWPGAFNAMPREQLGRVTGEHVDVILRNIEATRENIDDETVRVWDLRDVPALAFQELGVPEDSVLGDAVRNHIRDEKSDEFWLDIALSALGIVAGAVAIFATGGLALVAGAVALGAGGVSLYRSSTRFTAESAAEYVALDPVIADISVNEPELIWVVLDVVGLVADVGDVVRLLRPAARAAMATGDVTAFAAEARRVAPEAADRLVRSAQGELLARGGRAAASDADLVAGAAGKVGRDLSPDEVDAELRLVAGRQPRQLAPGGEYVMEVPVPNSPHTWRMRRDGVWCRFSNGKLCLLPGAVPPQMQAVVVDVSRVSATHARAVLAALESDFPILSRFRLDISAIRRVLAKGPGVDAMKGQLLEELLAVRIRQSLRTRAGRAGLGIGETAGRLVFIEGHRITDAAGRQLTDGIIAVQRGGRLEVRLVLEAKSGGRSAVGLALGVQTVRQMSRADRLELFRYLKDLYPTSVADYVRTTHPQAFAAYAARRYDDLPDDVVIDVATHPRFRRSTAAPELPGEEPGRVLVTERGGQVRRDVERLFASDIRVDGRPVAATATPQRTRFVAALPEDVDTDFIEETMRQLGYGMDVMRFPISQDEIVTLARELAVRLSASTP